MDTANNPTGTSGNESLTIGEAASLLGDFLPDEGEQEETNAELETEETQDEAQSDETEEQSEEESDESEGEEVQEESQEQPKFTVKVDGQEVEVTLDELKSGYSRTQDYTRKTQEIAQQRKQFEQEFQSVMQERQQYAQLLGALQQQLQEPEPDWDTLRSTDPIEYSLQMADWQRKQQKKQIAQAEQMRVAEQMQQYQMQQLQQRLAQENEALTALIPEWKDAERAKSIKSQVREQGKKLGFSEQELAEVYDHRAILALRKAALYDELMSKREQLKAAPPKLVKPGNKANPGNVDSQKALGRLKQTGKVGDAARAIELLLK